MNDSVLIKVRQQNHVNTPFQKVKKTRLYQVPYFGELKNVFDVRGCSEPQMCHGDSGLFSDSYRSTSHTAPVSSSDSRRVKNLGLQSNGTQKKGLKLLTIGTSDGAQGF